MKRTRSTITAELTDLRAKRARYETMVAELGALAVGCQQELDELDHAEGAGRAVTVPWDTFVYAAGHSRSAWKEDEDEDDPTSCDHDSCWYKANRDRVDGFELYTIMTHSGMGWSVCDMCFGVRSDLAWTNRFSLDLRAK